MTSRHDDVTVVVTNYNYGEFLEEAVKSVLTQDGGAPRIIVVDDGSTDPGTIAILDRLPDDVRVVRQENAGVAAARNNGLALAETPYLMILDADDRLRPRALNLLRAPLDADAGLGFTYGKTRFFGEWEGELTMPADDPYKLLYRHTIGRRASCAARVDVVGGYDPNFGGYEDWESAARPERGLAGAPRRGSDLRVPPTRLDEAHGRSPRVPPLVPLHARQARRPLRPSRRARPPVRALAGWPRRLSPVVGRPARAGAHRACTAHAAVGCPGSAPRRSLLRRVATLSGEFPAVGTCP